MSDSPESKKNSGLYEERRVYGSRKEMDKLNSGEKPRQKKKGGMPSQTGIYALIAVGVFVIAITVGLAGLFKKPAKKPTVRPDNKTVEEPEVTVREFSAVVLGTDTENRTITVFDVREDREFSVNYDGTTVFRGKEGTIITAGVLKEGDLLHFTCKAKDPKKLAEVGWSKDIWEKTMVDAPEIYSDENSIDIRGKKYYYSPDLCVMDNGVKKSIEDLVPAADRYTIRGEGTTILEMIVTIGHGTLQLINYESFENGLILIGDRYYLDICDPATYTVREGTYEVKASMGRKEASQTIEIKRNETVIFDLLPYGE